MLQTILYDLDHWSELFRDSEGYKQFIVHPIKMIQTIPVNCIHPSPNAIMRMFRIMRPGDVRVLIVSQEPYSSLCPITRKELAYGIAFYMNPGSHTVSATLKSIMRELMRCYPSNKTIEPNDMLCKWMSQGVFLANRSLTVASGLPPTEQHMCDHSVIWEWFSREFIRYMSSKYPTVLFVFMGSKAWDLETSITSNSLRIKTPHPVSRGDEFIGCNVFTRINQKIDPPIQWLPDH